MATVKCPECGTSGWCERHMSTDWPNSSPALVSMDLSDVRHFLSEQAGLYRACGYGGGQWAAGLIQKYVRFVDDAFLGELLTFTKTRSSRSEWRQIPEFTAWLETELARRKVATNV